MAYAHQQPPQQMVMTPQQQPAQQQAQPYPMHSMYGGVPASGAYGTAINTPMPTHYHQRVPQPQHRFSPSPAYTQDPSGQMNIYVPQQHPQQQPQPPSEYRPVQQFQFFGHDPNIPVPIEMCLLGCVFLIVDYERLLDQKEVQVWKTVVMMHGGEVENLYTERCTHVICESLRHPVVQQALKEGKRCVTAQWLNDCLMQKRMTYPWKAVHFPSSYADNKPCKNKIFSISGFDENERYCLMQMISAVGGKFNCYLSRHTHYLIAKRMSPCPEDEEIESRRKEIQPMIVASSASVPRIAFSGLYPAEVDNLKRKALWLGGDIVGSAQDATHVVCTDLKRTKKLLEAISLGRFVMQPSWIRQSYKHGQFLDSIDYMVKDEGNEKFFGFNLKLSICQARQRRLFEQILFYLTPSVIPGPSTLRDLIRTAGGQVLSERPLAKQIANFYETGKEFYIVTCDTDLHLCQNLIDCGVVVQSVEFVLTGILRQEVDPVPFRIENRQTNADQSKA